MNLIKLFMSLFIVTLYIDGGEGAGGGEGEGEAGGAGAGGGEGEGAAEWYFTEGVAGQGDRPDFFKDKYKTLADQAKAYTDLESRFGGFTGAPEQYEIPEGFEEDPIVATLAKYGKDSNMNQELFAQLASELTEGAAKRQEEALQAEIASIPNYETRRRNVADLALKVLRTDQFDAINSIVTGKESFEAVEALVNSLKGNQLPTGDVPPVNDQFNIGEALGKLDPSDMNARARLMEKLNATGGQGKLV